MKIDLTGKKALVTGAAVGIGHGIAKQLARCGADVVIHYGQLSENTSARQAAGQFRELGVAAKTIFADFRHRGEVHKLVDQTIKHLGGLDILINNAGVTFNKALSECTATYFDEVVDINLRATLQTSKAAASALRQNGGSIVNLASIHGLFGRAGHTIYAATKGAIISATRAMAMEYAPNIRVNAIAPGWIETDYQHRIMDFDASDVASKIPLARLGQPEDVGYLAAFLASKYASYTTGEVYVIDGGLTAGLHVDSECCQISDAPFGQGYITDV